MIVYQAKNKDFKIMFMGMCQSIDLLKQTIINDLAPDELIDKGDFTEQYPPENILKITCMGYSKVLFAAKKTQFEKKY